MSDVLNKMKSRRSIRKFKPDMVPQEILDQIIEAGLYAASGMGQQSPIIIQVTKKELRDATIKAIDDEIEARKRLNEDNDLEKQINEVKAQLKYGQLDEFSREQMEKKLQGLYDDKAEKEWQRNAQARKNAANAKYESEQKSYNNQISAINESLKTVQQIMSAMADGSKTVESIVNNDNTRNNTANVNLIGTTLTMAQITKAVKDALMDDIVIR